jgi:hypothetical protein
MTILKCRNADFIGYLCGTNCCNFGSIVSRVNLPQAHFIEYASKCYFYIFPTKIQALEFYSSIKDLQNLILCCLTQLQCVDHQTKFSLPRLAWMGWKNLGKEKVQL